MSGLEEDRCLSRKQYRQLVEAIADDMLEQIVSLNAGLGETIRRTEATRQRLADPQWVERVRERTRQEVAVDPTLRAGVAQLVGIRHGPSDTDF